MNWWNKTNVTAGKSFMTTAPTVTITTDTSDSRWGAHIGKLNVRGIWKSQESVQNINQLKWNTVFLALKAFQQQLWNKSTQIQTENTTKFYLNKQRGTKSFLHSKLAQQIWRWAIQRQITITVTHLPGVVNVVRNKLSRQASISRK